jgi:hypothetical protein
MNNRPALSLLLAFALGFPSLAEAADRTLILRAINQVENPTNRTGPGPKGELGPYQFRRNTWKMHSDQPFVRANERVLADEVAAKHYEWIRRGLIKAGLEPSVFNIALAWNGGLSAVTAGRTPAASMRYARRVANLVNEAEHQPRAAATGTLQPWLLAVGEMDPVLVP